MSNGVEQRISRVKRHLGFNRILTRLKPHSEQISPLLLGSVAGFLYLFRLDTESIWYDEAFTLWIIDHDFLGILTEGIINLTPPLYYWFMSIWVGIVPQSVFWYRLPSALASVAAVVGVYFLATEMADQRAGVYAGLLLLVSSPVLVYREQIRMYAVFMAAALWSTVVLLRLCHSANRRRTLIYGVLSTVTVLTHPYGLFVVGAHIGFIVIKWFRGERIDRRILSAVTPPIAFGGAWAILVVMFREITREAPKNWSINFDTVMTTLDWTMGQLPLMIAGPLLCIAVVRGAKGWPSITTRGVPEETMSIEFDPDQTILILTLIGTPILGAWLGEHLVGSTWYFRYVFFWTPILFAFVGIGISRLSSSITRTATLIMILGIMLQPIPAFYAEQGQTPWEDGVAAITEDAQADDLILVNNKVTKEIVELYLPDSVKSKVSIRTQIPESTTPSRVWSIGQFGTPNPGSMYTIESKTRFRTEPTFRSRGWSRGLTVEFYLLKSPRLDN